MSLDPTKTPLEQKRAEAAKAMAERTSELDRVAALAKEVFSTPAGNDLLRHLIHKYDLLGRSFLPDVDGRVCIHRSAIRDGERATVNYLITLIRRTTPDFPIPL